MKNLERAARALEADPSNDGQPAGIVASAYLAAEARIAELQAERDEAVALLRRLCRAASRYNEADFMPGWLEIVTSARALLAHLEEGGE